MSRVQFSKFWFLFNLKISTPNRPGSGKNWAKSPSWRVLSMPFNLGFHAFSSRDGIVEMVFNFIWNHLNRSIMLCEYSKGLRFENWVLTLITKLYAVNEYHYHSCTIQCYICHRKIRPQAIAQRLHELKDLLEVICSLL